MARYANNTNVSQEKSRNEIERVITKYGADQFSYAWSIDGGAMIGFVYRSRTIKFTVPMPKREEFRLTATGIQRERGPAEKAWEKAGRQKWRALLLIIKAKLEAVESGVVSFEDEFLAHTMLPDGSTFGEWANEELDRAIGRGDMPKLLAAGT